MDVRNCKDCGRLFNYVPGGVPLCQNCVKKLEDKFALVKAFIYDNPGVGIQEVSETMEVPVSQVKRWIREERLAFAENSAIGIECESCGKLIKTGRFCDKCKGELVNKFGNVYLTEKPIEKPKDQKENPRMRYLDKEKQYTFLKDRF